MPKKVISQDDKLIDARDIFNLFDTPFIFRRKIEDYKKSIGSDSDIVDLNDFCRYVISSFNRITPKEVDKHKLSKKKNEAIYMLTEETAFKILKKQLYELTGNSTGGV